MEKTLTVAGSSAKRLKRRHGSKLLVVTTTKRLNKPGVLSPVKVAAPNYSIAHRGSHAGELVRRFAGKAVGKLQFLSGQELALLLRQDEELVGRLMKNQESLERKVRALTSQLLRQDRIISTLTQHKADAAAEGADSGRARRALAQMQRRLELAAEQYPDASQRLEQLSHASKQHWIEQGLVLGSTELGAAWGRTRQALDQAVARGELFSLKIANRRWYPTAFSRLDPEQVKGISVLLRDIDPVAQFLFWQRRHGSLGGRTVPEAVHDGDLQAVTQLAEAFALEELGHVAALA